MTGNDRSMILWIGGVPAPKGSLDPINKRSGVLRGSDRSIAWGARCARAIADHVKASGWERLDGPCALGLSFYLPTDPTATRSGDYDKLARSVSDALTKGGAYRDDVLVTSGWQRKTGPHPPSECGVLIDLRPEYEPLDPGFGALVRRWIDQARAVIAR